MFKQYVVKITPRANAKENYVKRRCYLTMAKSLDDAKKQAIDNTDAPRSAYKLEVLPYSDGDKYKYVIGIDGELIEVSDYTDKPTEETETDSQINQDEVTDTETETAPTHRTESNSNGKPKRTRRFCLTSYIEPNALSKYVQTQPWIQHWSMCTHDKDIEKNGKPKQIHTHVLLYTYETKTSSAMMKKFDRFSEEYYKGSDTPPQNTLVQICHDMSAQWRYQIHADDLDKYQYPKEARICDDFSYWHTLDLTFGMNDSKSNGAFAIISDINDGCSEADLVLRYGREYVINRAKYHISASFVRSEVSRMKEWDIHEVIDLCLAGIHNRSEDEKRIFLEVFNDVRVECIMSYGIDARLIFDDKAMNKYDSEPTKKGFK